MAMHPLFDLTGKAALVTGGSKGLGKAMARGFAEAGADVFISSRSEEELKKAAAEIGEGLSVKVEGMVADMVDRAQVKNLAVEAEKRLGKVDILVNNAGSNAPQAIDEITDEAWDRIVELDLTSCMALSRALVPGMKSRKWAASSMCPPSWVWDRRRSAMCTPRARRVSSAWPRQARSTWARITSR